jgi:hypothetical protein
LRISKIKILAILIIILTTDVHSAVSQSNVPGSRTSNGNVLPSTDTLVTRSSHDSNKVISSKSVISSHGKSPLLAVALSLAVPGGGQIYNGSYWKAPIVLGLQAFFVSEWISNNKTYKYYQQQYQNSILSMPPYGNPYIKAQRDAWRDQRDSYSWYIAVTAVLSVVDAYVDAQLSEFDVSNTLSINILPRSESMAVTLQMKF